MSRLFSRRKRMMEDLDQDIRDFIERETQDNIERGLPPQEARYAALRKFGNVTRVREETWELWSFVWLEQLWQDVRVGLRQLRRNPAFTVVAVLTLALGIGANIAAFSLVDAVLLRSLPYKNANRLTFIGQRLAPERIGAAFDTYREFEQWERYSHSFEKLAAATWLGVQTVWSWHGERRQVGTVLVTVNFLSMLGVHAAQGRTFGPQDLRNPCAVLLAHRFWEERLGGALGWVGRTLILNNTGCTVVGIMPKNFSFYPKQTELWKLITPESEFSADPWNKNVIVLGLLRRGVSRVGAQAELTALENRIIGEAPDLARLKPQPDVLDLQRAFTWLTGRELRSGLILLFAAAFLVVLITCVNIANLLLGWAGERRREFGVRIALGSGRARLIRQLLTESLMLSLGGAAIGMVVALFCIRYVTVAEATQLPPGNPIALNWQVLGFAAFLVILTTVVFGLYPAWSASRVDLNEVLKESAATASRRALGQGVSRAPVVVEMALSLIVLTAAGLLVNTLFHLTNAPLGYDPSHLLTTTIGLPPSSYPKQTDRTSFWDRLEQRIDSLPGVNGVAFSPFSPRGGVSLTIEGVTRESSMYSASEDPVSTDYFDVMRIPVLQGRTFDVQDRQHSLPVAIVNQAFAGEFFPERVPLGQRIKLGISDSSNPWLTVVGVVGNVQYPTLHMGYASPACVYVPLAQASQNTLSLFIRTAVTPQLLESPIRRELSDVDSNLPPPEFATMNQWLSQFVAQPQFRATLFGAFAALSVLLAALGVYGVTAHTIARRTHEIGVRMALGAQRGDVMRLFVGKGMLLALVGVGIGLAGASAVTRFLSSLLYGVSPTDPLTFVVVSLALLGVAALACFLPARRATKVDPMVALRYE
jgi:putative ABC transport system permease protein